MAKVQKHIKQKVGVFLPDAKPIVTGLPDDAVVSYLARDCSGSFYMVTGQWDGCWNYDVFVGKEHQMKKATITDHIFTRDASLGTFHFDLDGKKGLLNAARPNGYEKPSAVYDGGCVPLKLLVSMNACLDEQGEETDYVKRIPSRSQKPF